MMQLYHVHVIFVSFPTSTGALSFVEKVHLLSVYHTDAPPLPNCNLKKVGGEV